MNVILLSGGSGKRLWPLSNDIRSKQFIKIFKNDEGAYESMVQRVYRQLMSVDPDSRVTIATSAKQVSALRNQLSQDVDISREPCKRNTFPAIALAAAYQCDVMGVSPEETVVVCPVDPYVNRDYFVALKELAGLSEKGGFNLSLLGIKPTSPSDQYGYILPESKERVTTVSKFREKPDTETAKEYIRQGALWNSGVFAFKLSYAREKAKELLGTADYQELLARYETLKSISFDYAVVEKEARIQVLRFDGEWRDIGAWRTFTEVMDSDRVGDVIMNDRCENVHVINELRVPVLAMGLKNVVVALSPEGVLVSDWNDSSLIKPFVDTIDQHIRFAEKSWGQFTVLDVGPQSLTARLDIKPGRSLTYHAHAFRSESWTVIAGEGEAVLEGETIALRPGVTVEMPAGARHRVTARTELSLIEVQTGDSISAADKSVFPWENGEKR